MQVRQGVVATSDGARLYHEIRGSGPPLLLVQGGLGDGGATRQLADELSADHTVISYDRRGISRSTVTGAEPAVTMQLHADDAAALLAALAPGPAIVVGASIGALIGLHLAVGHSERVSTLVAHEPPMPKLVPDPETEAALAEIEALARDDARAAIGRMAARTGAGDSVEPDARPAPPAGDLDDNLRRFFAHDFPAVRASDLGLAAIAAAAPMIVPTGGHESRGRWEYRCAERLATGLGRALTELPGGHNGLAGHPRGVAVALRHLLAARRY